MSDDGEVLETIGDLRVRLVQDEDPMSPRDASNVGVMWCRHRDYTLGDQQFSAIVPEFDEVSGFVDDILEHLSGNDVTEAIVKHLKRTYGSTVVMPLYLHDHSGITIRSGINMAQGVTPSRRPAFSCDPGGWDTSFVGFVFDTKRTLEVTGVTPEHAEEALKQEVETYASYLKGDSYGYIVERKVIEHHTQKDGKGNVLREFDTDEWEEEESCWGYLGHKYAEEEARAALTACLPKPVPFPAPADVLTSLAGDSGVLQSGEEFLVIIDGTVRDTRPNREDAEARRTQLLLETDEGKA